MSDRGNANLPQIVSSQRWQSLQIDLVSAKAGRYCPRPRPSSHSAMFTGSPGFLPIPPPLAYQTITGRGGGDHRFGAQPTRRPRRGNLKKRLPRPTKMIAF